MTRVASGEGSSARAVDLHQLQIRPPRGGRLAAGIRNTRYLYASTLCVVGARPANSINSIHVTCKQQKPAGGDG